METKSGSKNKILFAVILVIVIGLVIAGLIWLILSLTGIAKQKTIDVSGRATVRKDADKVWMSIGVETQADKASVAEAENTQISNEIYNSLEDLGLTSKDYKTESYNVYPHKDWEKSGEIEGYTVVHRIRIDTDKVDLAGKILDDCIEAGANSIYGVYFDLSTTKREEARAEALEQATQIAREKAEGIAKGLEVKITGIKSVSDSSINYVPYRFAEIGVAEVESKGADSVITEPGSVEVSANIYVSYKFS